MSDEHKLFVGKLPIDITDEELRIVFNTYGKVQNVHIMSKGRPGDHDGPRFACAFVYYDTNEACKAAIQVLDNIYKIREDARDPIHVSYALAGGGKGDKGDRGGRDRRDDRDRDDRDGRGRDDYRDRDRGRDRSRDRGGYDRGPPPRDHYDHYDPYGKGKGGYAPDRGYGGGSSYGGSYPDRGHAPSYPDQYRGGGHDSWHNGGGRGRGHDDYDRGYGRDKGGDSRSGGSYDSGSSKLYVANLPNDITNEAMDMVFSTYGRVEDIHIMTGRSKSGKACAFVRYTTPSAAQIAISALAQGYEIRPGEGEILVKSADPDSRRDGKGKGGEKGGRDRSRDRDRSRPY